MTRFGIDALVALRLVQHGMTVDAFITLDAELARRVEGVVTIAPFEALGPPAQVTR